jgi:hypothetical protein
MIRKRVGETFWLITQRDHALLAGQIARAWGNRQFAKPVGGDVVYTAVDDHDDGWPDHDDHPTLDEAGRPTDVFEAARALSHPIWLNSARRATERGLYTGLLVSLHQLSLSAHAASVASNDKIDDETRRRQFDLNKIQHALIEHAENLRAKLGLVTDRPLRLGLADGWTNTAEENLKFDFRLLQAVDALSLHVCCDHVPPGIVPAPHARPGTGQIQLQVVHLGDGTLGIGPWPFDEPELILRVPYRTVPAMAYDSLDRFRADYAAAPVKEFECRLRPA